MTCPICAAPSNDKFRPFCSNRCANIDLARWLNGHYAIPTDEPAEQPTTTPDAPPRDIH